MPEVESEVPPERRDVPQRMTMPMSATVQGRTGLETGNGGDSSSADAARVLIVDDEADVRLTLRAVLRRSTRLRVVAEAEDGESALELIRESLPDIVLLDLMMPKLDGREVAPVIFRESPQTMIVVLSALAAAEEAESLLAQGAFAYVEKSEMGPRLAQGLETLWDRFRRALTGEDVWAPAAGNEPLL